jgi:magnesium-transporting ATPase (P-type)
MRNADEAKPKTSNIDRLSNMLIFYILLIQIGCCLLLSVLFSIRCYANSNVYKFFNDTSYGCFANSTFTFLSYFLLLNTLIPISLIVSLEFVKMS